MKKAIFIKSKAEGGKNTVTGNLVAINEVKTEKATGFIAVIGNGDKEYFKVGFFNGEKVNFTERAEKSGLKKSVGKPITVVYTERGELNLGSNWAYPGNKVDIDESTSVYFSRVAKMKTGSKGQAIVTLPVRNGKETEWHMVSFFDTEKFDIAKKVQQYLKVGDLVLVRADNYKVINDGMHVANGRAFDKIY